MDALEVDARILKKCNKLAAAGGFPIFFSGKTRSTDSVNIFSEENISLIEVEYAAIYISINNLT